MTFQGHTMSYAASRRQVLLTGLARNKPYVVTLCARNVFGNGTIATKNFVGGTHRSY
jgi:hypothetical protein